jgi:hypothetical protein
MHVLIFGALASTVCGVIGTRVAQATSDTVAAHAASAAGTAAPAAGDLSFSPMLGLPAGDVGLIGSASSESAGETWAQGEVGAVPATVGGQTISNQQVLLRYTDSQGDWQIVPLDNSAGSQISFQWTASRVTPQGGLALIGEPANATGSGQQTLVTRAPGGAFAAASAPPSSVLQSGEQLYSTSGSNNPLLATIEDGSGVAAFVVPYQTSSATAAPGVLRFAQNAWTREPVCSTYTPGTGGAAGTCAPVPAGYTPLALAAASGSSAWLLASTTAQPLQLFQRQTESDGTVAWVAVKPNSFLVNASASKPSGESVQALGTDSPMLTATTQGVWVDATLGGSTSGSATTLIAADSDNAVLGTWCYPQSLCPGATGSLGAQLTSGYASTAWAGSGSSDPGSRVITGVGSGATLLVLDNGASSFQYTVGIGAFGGASGDVGPGSEAIVSSAASGGAAFSTVGQGWLGVGATSGGAQLYQVNSSGGSADQLSSWPVTFEKPLLAVASQPGAAVGAAGSEALAVGLNGEISWYKQSEGWQPDYLYNSAGVAQTPNLRGVAWPEAGRAYAVGDNGAMWLWQSTTDLWEPDPAAPIGNTANFNAIAFDPDDPDVGYAVGNQGTLLAYGKTWTQVSLPTAVQDANFTSVTFAGSEAIVGYEQPISGGNGYLTGGLLVNDGSGWQVDQSAQALLESEPAQTGGEGAYRDDAIFKVSGLSDGGAVAAGPGVLIERDSASGSWHFSSEPLPEAANVSALAAYQGSDGKTQALVSIDTGLFPDTALPWIDVDDPTISTAAGSLPTILEDPNPISDFGYVLRQTAAGWHDLERGASRAGARPDAVLALDVSADGSEGWAVGGTTAYTPSQTISAVGQTAGVMRFGAGASSPGQNTSSLNSSDGQVTFALGGDANCYGACADDADDAIGPDIWTTAALKTASSVNGLRGFLWAGGRLGNTLTGTSTSGLSADAMARELDRYGQLLSSASIPVHAAISYGDVNSNSSVSAFAAALGSAAPIGETLSGTAPPPSGTAAYAFQSTGSGGAVDVIALDFASATGGDSYTLSSAQLSWLRSELDAANLAGAPAIVLGAADLASSNASNYASDASAVASALASGGASAYLFDSPGDNLAETIRSGGTSIPAYGSGSLGTEDDSTVGNADGYFGAHGFLLVNVDAAKRDATTNVAPVTAELIPSISALSIDAVNGTLLRRSQVALFDAAARIPPTGEFESVVTPAYVSIPETCNGSLCNEFIAPQYTFTSSNPDIGDFVEQDPASTSSTAVYLKNGNPVADSHSGLFCAYNAGTTTITVSTGGLSYSEAVTIQGGSVAQPCRTVPLTNPPVLAPQIETGFAAGSGHPHLVSSSTPIAPPSAPPSPSPSAVPVPHPVPAPVSSSLPVLPVQPFTFYDVPSIIPPTAPSNLRPTPPSGTAEVQGQSPVSQNIELLEDEREHQSATQSVHHMVAYDPDGQNGIPLWPLALIPALALAAASVRRPRRRGQLLQERMATVRICDSQIRDDGHRRGVR